MEKEVRTIDIGCGFNPVKEATHAIDAYLGSDNQERGADLVIPEGVIFSQQDIEKGTDFEDGYFDYSWCKMVLEHCHDPAKAMNEIMRISKAGYIVVPTWTWEILHGRPYHKQLFWMDGDTLCFTEKNQNTYKENEYDGDGLWSNKEDYYTAYVEHRDLFEIRLEWRGSFDYRKVEPFQIYSN